MKILAVEDDRYLGEILQFLLGRAGHTLVRARTGEQAQEAIVLHAPQLILLDLTPPSHEALELCRRLQRLKPTPIVLFSHADREAEAERWSGVGVCQVLNKPFPLQDLLDAVDRAAHQENPKPAPPRGTVYSIPPFFLDAQSLEVHRTGRRHPIVLNPIEAKLLHQLMRHVGQIVSELELVQALWRADKGAPEQLPTVFQHLQIKLEVDPARPRHLKVTPQGYLLVGETNGRTPSSAKLRPSRAPLDPTPAVP